MPTFASDAFAGKTILLTGAGSGLGRECALQWSAMGAQVVVTDLVPTRVQDVTKQIEEAGGSAAGVVADVTEEDQIAAAVDLAVSTFGKLDVAFANAGREPEGHGSIALENVSATEWDDVHHVNLRGVFFTAKHSVRAMKGSGSGNVVVTISAGALNSYPGFGSYCASKAGAIGLVRSMAYDWGKFGIRVNALAPTHGMSPNLSLPLDAPVAGMSREEWMVSRSGDAWDAKTMFQGPLKVDRPPSLGDNAAVATFLASDASQYMSGVTIPSCDGGSFARTSIQIPEDWSVTDYA